jgi:hypothetical protein
VLASETMQLAILSTHSLHREHVRRMATVSSLSLVCALAMVACSPQAEDAGTAAVKPEAKASSPAGANVSAGPKWQDLTKAQRLILQPLAASWDSLGSMHKSKWIAVAQSYPSRAEADQKKMQERMVEWAALTPAERERARLNFAETKKISPSNRAAEWEAYQSLSAQERERLASRGSAKPAGAAVAVTPVASDKLTPVPVTRHTPLQDGDTSAAKPKINPNTLLPETSVAPASAPAPAPATPPASPDSGPPVPSPESTASAASATAATN